MSDEHDLMHEWTGLYAAGALSPADREAFERHLETCPPCATEVASLRGVMLALPYALPQMDPPASLRDRVLRATGATGTVRLVPGKPDRPAVETARTASRLGMLAISGWLSAAALLVLSVALGGTATSLRRDLQAAHVRLDAVQSQLEAAGRQLAASRDETTAVRTRLAVLTAPDGIELSLVAQASAGSARARAFMSRTRGVLLAATNLPAIPDDRTYQAWFLTRGTPISAGLFRPDDQGAATAMLSGVPDGVDATGFAVSLEPAGGVPAPTGAIYLVSH
jgi:anti-sigma-K factor RskA